MNVMNMDISSWTALPGYPLQEHQHHTTRHTETATPDQALGTTRKTEKEKTGPDHSLDTADTTAPAMMLMYLVMASTNYTHLYTLYTFINIHFYLWIYTFIDISG